LSSCSHTTTARETILDHKTHIEDKIVYDLPQVSRLCDELDITKGYADVGDCKLYYEIDGSGTPIVFINGGPGGTHYDFHFGESLPKDNFKVIYYDQRGCGLSEHKAVEGYSFEQTIDDLEKLRQALKIDKWIVAGHSYGGGIAQYYSIKYPGHVLGQVLIGTVPMMNLDEFRGGRTQNFYSEAEMAKMTELRTLFQKGQLTRSQYTYNMMLNGSWKRSSFVKPGKDQMVRMVTHGISSDPNYSSDFTAYNFEHVFETCPVPTLIVEGKHDLIWKADRPAIFKKYHPNAQIVVLESSGHNMFADEPVKFNRAIVEWTNTLSNPSEPDLLAWQQRSNDLIGNQLILIESNKSFASLIRTSGIDAGLKYYEEIKNEQPDKPIFFENTINMLGYEYLFAEKHTEAIEIFKLNVQEFPESWNVYDSLGEAYLKSGQTVLGYENYKRSVELNPDNENGQAILDKLNSYAKAK
jgi:proline iminopeptidase